LCRSSCLTKDESAERAEEYHQDYYKKNPVRYKTYKWNCGREQRLDRLWGASTH